MATINLKAVSYMNKYKRVLIKLSGEALAGDKGYGYDYDYGYGYGFCQ